MQTIQIRTDGGQTTIKVSADQILEETVAIHVSVGLCARDAAKFAKENKFNATHIATGFAIIRRVPKDVAEKAAKTFLEVLPEDLRKTSIPINVGNGVPGGFGAWIEELEAAEISDFDPEGD